MYIGIWLRLAQRFRPWNAVHATLSKVTHSGLVFADTLCQINVDHHIFPGVTGLLYPFFHRQQIGRQIKQHLHGTLQRDLPSVILNGSNDRITCQTIFQFKRAQTDPPGKKQTASRRRNFCVSQLSVSANPILNDPSIC